MNSKLRPTLVTMGIAFGATLPGCFGKTGSDEPRTNDGPDQNGPAESDADETDPRSDDPLGPPHLDPPDDPDPSPLERYQEDPTLAAFCDETWPPTKGNGDPPAPLCIDPEGECEGAPIPPQCWALLDDGVCDFYQKFMHPLSCVDGAWQCPPGSTQGWECSGDECEDTCRCWGPLPEGMICGEDGIEGLGGATGSE